MAGAATGAGVLGWRLPALAEGPAGGAAADGEGYLTAAEIRTLDAALARMIPASGAGDWSAADLGVATYIDNILSAFRPDLPEPAVFAGGPYRDSFPEFQQLSRVKSIGWNGQISQWQKLYRSGLAALDTAAGGDFAAVPALVQDAILEKLDLSGDQFFSVLYDHTMEGTYSHPVYGGNSRYRAWKTVGFAGDVHGVRFPHIGPVEASWNVYGGYAPEEIIAVGNTSTEQPVTSSSSSSSSSPGLP